MKSKIDIKTVMFDLDGTLADTIPLCIAAFKKTITSLQHKTVSDEEIITTFGPSEEGTIREFLPDRQQEGLQEFLRNYEVLHDEICPEPFAGITGVLDFLKEKGIHVVMVTSKGVNSTEISMRKLKLASYFELVETGSPEKPIKVEGIQKVLQQLQIAPENSFYVGDAASDVKYAREAGIRIAAVAWAKDTDTKALTESNPEWLFNDVAIFKQWLIDLTTDKPIDPYLWR